MPWEQTEHEIKHRLQDPELFEPDSFRTKEITDGVSLIIGKKPGGDKMEVQALRFDGGKFDLEKAQAWYETHKGDLETQGNYSLPETRELQDVEIFAVGVWNGDKYTEKDLKEIVAGFQETREALQPYVKLGHNKDQKLLKQDGLPAAGWITNLKMKGRKLVADVVGVPQKIYDLIKAGAYKRVSSEIFFDIEIDGKRYPKLLKAISLLGADTPAVTNLNDVLALYSFEDAKDRQNIARTYEIDRDELRNCTKGDAKMEEIMKLMKKMMEGMEGGHEPEVEDVKMLAQKLTEKYQLPNAEAEAEKAKAAQVAEEKKKAEETAAAELKSKEELLTAKDKQIEELAVSKKELEAKNDELTEKMFTAEVDKKLDDLINDKKIVPAQREPLRALMFELRKSGSTRKYKIGEEEKSPEDILMTFTSTLDVKVNTETKTETGKSALSDEPNPETGFTGEALDSEAKKYMSEHQGVDYKTALFEVKKQRKAK